MKKAFVILGGIIFVLTILLGLVDAAEKFAFIDLSRIFSEYNKTKDYDKVLGEKETVYNTERDKKVNDVKQMQDKMDLLSDKEKESKRGELETKVKALQDFDRQKQTDLRKEFGDKKTEIIKDIHAVVKQYAEKEGYALVFNEAGVVYNAKSLDVTDKIIEALNKNYKK